MNAASSIRPDQLRLEYEENPLGVDLQNPRFGWQVCSDEADQFQTSYQIQVASSKEALAREQPDLWDSEKVVSQETVAVCYKGKPLAPDERYYWCVRLWDGAGRVSPKSPVAFWQTGLMGDANWQAEWIVPASQAADRQRQTAPLLRRDFQIRKQVARATAFVSVYGWYELYLNGKKVGALVTSPTQTPDFERPVYNTLEITDALKIGRNAVGLWLGDGYNENYSPYGWRYTGPKRAIVQLHLRYQDGSEETVCSDTDWNYTEQSPLLYNHVYHGEIYDARREQPGWSCAGFDDSAWEPVRKAERTVLPVSTSFPGVSVQETFPCSRLDFPDPAVAVFDFGQNLAGWVRLRVKGTRGTRIVIRYAEEVDEQGRIYTRTNRAAQAADVYILKGGAEELYEPRFTYHGFRYVEIRGLSHPDPSMVVACAIRARLKPAGFFSCSNPLLNQIHHNACWSLKGNLQSFPTDCAARDERTPCVMDSSVCEEAAICNFEMHGFYEHWLRMTVKSDGTLPDWDGAKVSLAWRLFRYYSDRRILQRSYAPLSHYIRAGAQASASGLFEKQFGDWCAPNPDNEYAHCFSCVPQTSTALFIHQCALMAEIARCSGNSQDVLFFQEQENRFKAAFHQAFFDAEHKRYGNRQGPNILALVFDIVPMKWRAAVEQSLKELVHENGDRLDTGIYSTPYLVEALAKQGDVDEAIQVLLGKEYPGFGYEISQGATTMWEQWKDGPGQGGMQSHNHLMFSGIDRIFYTVLGGITPLEDGFRRVRIHPFIPRKLSSVRCSVETVRGTVVSNWSQGPDGFHIHVEIPANCGGVLELPFGAAYEIFRQEKPVPAVYPNECMMRVELGNGKTDWQVRKKNR